MKEKKRTLEIFSYYDCSRLEKHLTKMAEKGWLLESISSFLWTYRRIEPEKLTFCVCWYPKASAFDPEPSEEQQTFYDFCQHTGWVLAGAFGQMQVFYNEAPDPILIETDPVMEVDAIHRSAKRTFLPSQLVLLVLSLLNGWLFAARLLNDPVGVLASAANLFTGLCWLFIFLLEAVECGGYFLWHHRAVRAAEQGEFLEAKGHRTFQLICLAAVGLGMVYYLVSILTSEDPMMIAIALLMFGVYLPGVYLLTYGIKTFLKKKKASARVNRTVTILSAFAAAFVLLGGITWGVLFGSTRSWFAGSDETYEYHGEIFTAPQDKLPLTVEDLMDVKIPELIVQPLVENCIEHGLKDVKYPPVIRLDIQDDNGQLKISVSDNGSGISSSKQYEIQKIFKDNTGEALEAFALKNIHDRLKLYYGKDSSLIIYSEAGNGTRIEITIPMQDGGKQNVQDTDRR